MPSMTCCTSGGAVSSRAAGKRRRSRARASLSRRLRELHADHAALAPRDAAAADRRFEERDAVCRHGCDQGVTIAKFGSDRVEQAEEREQRGAAAVHVELVREDEVLEPDLARAQLQEQLARELHGRGGVRVGLALPVVQHGVLEVQHVRLADVGEHEVQRERLLLGRLRAVEARRHGGEEQLERNAREDVAGEAGVEPAALGRAVAQLVRAGQVDGAPDAALGLVAELVVGAREQLARLGVLRVGEHEVVEQRRGPAVVAARRAPRCAFSFTAAAPPIASTYFAPSAAGGSGSRFAGLPSYQPK